MTKQETNAILKDIRDLLEAFNLTLRKYLGTHTDWTRQLSSIIEENDNAFRRLEEKLNKKKK